MGLSFRGLDEFRGAFERVRDGASNTSSETARRHLEETVYPLSQTLVPKLTGDLAGTGRVEEGSSAGAWALRYGNSEVENRAEVDYAAAVHERDATHLPPTQYKYVEKPLKETVEQFRTRAARAFKDLADGA
jgi:hypothetical protein